MNRGVRLHFRGIRDNPFDCIDDDPQGLAWSIVTIGEEFCFSTFAVYRVFRNTLDLTACLNSWA